MLVTMREILNDAEKKGYGVAAPNAYDENHVRYIIEVAEEYNAPMIIDITEANKIDIQVLGRNTVDMCKAAKVPIAINQDHGKTFEGAVKAIRAGVYGKLEV